MTKKNIQCCLAGLGRMTTLRAQGRRGFDGIMGSERHGIGEDDDAVGPGMAQVIGVVGSRMMRSAQHRELGEDDVVTGLGTASRAWGRGLHGRWRHWLGPGKMAVCKGLNHGREGRCGGFGEDSTMARAPGRPTTVRAPGKFLAGIFGSMTA
jgi:hypothetical protein